ncbi:MAG: ferredoxin [Piscirickettsiaceae bacterium]|nr:MAG: ferredoxin [Piscirickettsiaceae bacterium]
MEIIEIDQSKYVFVCEVGSLPAMASKAFSVELGEGKGCDGFLVRTDDDNLYAYVNTCPHTGAPLNWTPDQFLTSSGRYIQCSIHGAMFKSDTGECFAGPCSGKFLKILRVVEQTNKAYVALADI